MSSKSTVILAIETSCDETAISIIRASADSYSILSNIVSSQVKLHAKWGGVVPNLAAREHVKNLPSVLKMALDEAQISPAAVDAIGITNGPGLIPALLTGTSMAKTLAYVWNKPLLGIHHIEGHIYANFVGVNLKSQIPNPKQIQNSKTKEANIQFPILCLVVSGGHTQLVLMKNHLTYEIVGQTLDDAVGEAFDKVARILGIGYPGGPAVAAWAAKYRGLKANEAKSYKLSFPRPMMNRNNFDFSFSGLKTAVLYETKKHPELMSDPVKSTASRGAKQCNGASKKYIAAVCHEFQQAVVDVLVGKTINAAKQYKPKTIMLAGGVSANEQLRTQLGEALRHTFPAVSYRVPELALTGDNAAMIACAAAIRWQKMNATQKKSAAKGWETIQPNANLKLQSR